MAVSEGLKTRSRYFDSETLFGYSVTLVILLLICGPLLILVRNTFTSGGPGTPFEFTWEHWKLAFTSSAYRVALGHTLFLGITAPLMAGLMGIPFAWVVARTDTPLRRFWEQIAIVPLLIPAVIVGLAWRLIAARNAGLLNQALDLVGMGQETLNIYNPWGISFAIAVYLSPYVVLFVSGALKSMDPGLEEASRVCGGSIWRTMRCITVPAVLPAILGSLLLIFVLACDFVAIPMILGAPQKYYVMTTWIWRHVVHEPEYGVASILSIVLVAISMIGMYLSQRLLKGRSYAVISGKGFRPGIITLGRWKWLTSTYCALYMVVGIVLPLGVVFLASVQNYTWNWGFSLKTYLLMLKYPSAIVGMKNSFIVATLGSVVVSALGFCIAWLVLRSEFRVRKQLDYLSMMSLAVPGVSLAMGLLWTWVKVPLPIYGTIWIILIGLATRFMGTAVRSITASLQQVSPELEWSARVCGAKWYQSVIHVAVPLARPGIIAGMVLLFIIFFGDLNISLMLWTSSSRMASTVTMELWELAEFIKMACLGTMMVVIVLLVVVAFRVTTKENLGELIK